MQTVLHEKFVIDGRGRRTAVLIDVKEYAKLLFLLEEAQIIKTINQGEKEYRQGKLKPIHSLADLDK